MNSMKGLTKALKAVISLVVLVVVFFAGHYIGFNQGIKGYKGGILGNNENTYQAGWEAAKEKIKEHPIFNARVVNSLNGTVAEVNNNKIKINTNFISENPLDDPPPQERFIIVTENTVINEQKEKTEEQINEDIKEFETAREAFISLSVEEQQQAGPPVPPERITIRTISINEIQPNQLISVISVNNEDISFLKEFEASRIIITADR